MSKEIKIELKTPASSFLYPLPSHSENWDSFTISLGLSDEEAFAVELIYSASKNDLGHVRELLEDSGNPNIKAPAKLGNFRGKTALHCAKTAAMVDFLVDRGADLNICDATGKTPLMSAVLHNNEEVVARLLKLGANLDMVDLAGDTAQSIAARMAQSAHAARSLIVSLTRQIQRLVNSLIHLQCLLGNVENTLALEAKTLAFMDSIRTEISQRSVSVNQSLPLKEIPKDTIIVPTLIPPPLRVLLEEKTARVRSSLPLLMQYVIRNVNFRERQILFFKRTFPETRIPVLIAHYQFQREQQSFFCLKKRKLNIENNLQEPSPKK